MRAAHMSFTSVFTVFRDRDEPKTPVGVVFSAASIHTCSLLVACCGSLGDLSDAILCTTAK